MFFPGFFAACDICFRRSGAEGFSPGLFCKKAAVPRHRARIATGQPRVLPPLGFFMDPCLLEHTSGHSRSNLSRRSGAQGFSSDLFAKRPLSRAVALVRPAQDIVVAPPGCAPPSRVAILRFRTVLPRARRRNGRGGGRADSVSRCFRPGRRLTAGSPRCSAPPKAQPKPKNGGKTGWRNSAMITRPM